MAGTGNRSCSGGRRQPVVASFGGRAGQEDVAHFDGVMNLRQPVEARAMPESVASGLDLTRLIEDALSVPEIAGRGVQGIHAEVMRRLMSDGRTEFPDFHQVRSAL